MSENAESDELCEYVAPVEWAAAVERGQAKWQTKAGIFTTQLVRASLDGQPKTIAFLDKEFTVNIRELVA
jgi:hypothetical protein